MPGPRLICEELMDTSDVRSIAVSRSTLAPTNTKGPHVTYQKGLRRRVPAASCLGWRREPKVPGGQGRAAAGRRPRVRGHCGGGRPSLAISPARTFCTRGSAAVSLPGGGRQVCGVYGGETKTSRSTWVVRRGGLGDFGQVPQAAPQPLCGVQAARAQGAPLGPGGQHPLSTWVGP